MAGQAGLHRFHAYSVYICDDGAISVAGGDTLSGYSAALHRGDTRQTSEFGRLRGATLARIQHTDTVFRGETIYHMPTFAAFHGKGAVKPPSASSGPIVPYGQPAPHTGASASGRDVDPKTFLKAMLAEKAGNQSLQLAMLQANAIVQVLAALTGRTKAELDDAVRAGAMLKRGVEAVEIVTQINDCLRAASRKEALEASSRAFIAMGFAWGFIPERRRSTLIGPLKAGLSKSKYFGWAGTVIGTVDSLDAMGEFTQLIGCLGLPEPDCRETFQEGLKGLVDKMKENPSKAAPLVVPLLSCLLGMIPPETRERLIAKFATKEIPVVGLIVNLPIDLYNFYEEGNTAENWTSLTGTLAGEIPGVGTAISAISDVVVVGFELAKTINAIKDLGAVVTLKQLGVADAVYAK